MLDNVNVTVRRAPDQVVFRFEDSGVSGELTMSPVTAAFVSGQLVRGAVDLLRDTIAGREPSGAFLTLWILFRQPGPEPDYPQSLGSLIPPRWRPYRITDTREIATLITDAEASGFPWILTSEVVESPNNPTEPPYSWR